MRFSSYAASDDTWAEHEDDGRSTAFYLEDLDGHSSSGELADDGRSARDDSF